jgi:hypothetical protein
MRIAGDEAVTRIVIEFDKPVEVSHRLLDRPWRLVLDFNKIGYGFDADADEHVRPRLGACATATWAAIIRG